MRSQLNTDSPALAGRRAAPRGPLVFWAGAGGIAAVLLLYYSLVWQSFARFTQAIDVGTETFADFATFYYPMGEAIFRGGQRLEGFVYSPFAAILMAAFAWLPLNTALVVWGTLQAVGIVLYILLFRRLAGASLSFQLLFVLLLLSSFPLLHTVRWGQVSLFTTVAVWGALLCLERGQRPAGAGLLAFAASFKVIPLIFVVPAAARRDYRFLLWAAAALAALLAGIPLVLLGAARTLEFYRSLWSAYSNFGWAASNYNSQYFAHVILRLLNAAAPGLALPAVVATALYAIAWIVVLANLALVYLIQRAGLRRADLWSFALLFLTIPFLLRTSWPVDLVFLPFVQAWLAVLLFDSERAEAALSAGRRAAAGLLVLASAACSNVLLFNLVGDYSTYGSRGFVFWADLAALLAAYLLLWPQLWPRSGARAEQAPRQ